MHSPACRCCSPLIAPAAHHRLTFRLQDKKYVVLTANRLAIWGLACLAIAMTTAIALVTDVVFAQDTAIVASAAIGLLFLALWCVMPLRRRRQGR